MTVHFPIGLTAAGALFILIAFIKKSKAFETAAFYNIFLAFLSAIVASATGMRSNIITYEGAAPNASVKIALGTLLILITLITIILRLRDPELLWKPKSRFLYVLAYLVSFLIAMTLGFLGGVIIYGF
jgi:uncharacterized membrane protein